MAVPQERTYDAQAITANEVQLGGTSRLTVTPGYEQITRSRFGGRMGASRVLRGAKFVRGTLTCLDVTKVITLVTATPTLDADNIMTFYVAEEGTSPTTYTKHVLLRPVFFNPTVSIVPGGTDATFTVSFECRWVKADDTAADEFNEVDVTTTAVAEATVEADRVEPAILDEVTSVTHGAVAVEHPGDFSFQITGGLRKHRNGGFKGHDSIAWVVDGLQFDFRTLSSVRSAQSKTRVQELLDAAAADLVVIMSALDGGSPKTFTFANAVFLQGGGEHPAVGHHVFNPNGECEFFDGVNHFALTGANLILTIA